MRKGLTILGLFCIILSVSSVWLAPWLATSTLRTRLVQKLATEDVQVQLAASPGLVLALGQADSLQAVAHAGKVGVVPFRELTLTGERLKIDVPALLAHDGLQVMRAERLELRGIIDADGLRRVLTQHIDKLENVQVDIQQESILVTAQTKLLGRTADVELEGVVRGDSAGLYFDMTRLNIRNARVGTAQLGEMFGNITLAKTDKMPLGLRIQDVEQSEGTIIITAVRPPED